MRRNNSAKALRIEGNHFFYTCLVLVLAIAAFGIITDVMAGR